ncbi:hypothetical protein FCV25MIE_15238 [Fagus crenata]
MHMRERPEGLKEVKKWKFPPEAMTIGRTTEPLRNEAKGKHKEKRVGHDSRVLSTNQTVNYIEDDIVMALNQQIHDLKKELKINVRRSPKHEWPTRWTACSKTPRSKPKILFTEVSSKTSLSNSKSNESLDGRKHRSRSTRGDGQRPQK